MNMKQKIKWKLIIYDTLTPIIHHNIKTAPNTAQQQYFRLFLFSLKK